MNGNESDNIKELHWKEKSIRSNFFKTEEFDVDFTVEKQDRERVT